MFLVLCYCTQLGWDCVNVILLGSIVVWDNYLASSTWFETLATFKEETIIFVLLSNTPVNANLLHFIPPTNRPLGWSGGHNFESNLESLGEFSLDLVHLISSKYKSTKERKLWKHACYFRDTVLEGQFFPFYLRASVSCLPWIYLMDK